MATAKTLYEAQDGSLFETEVEAQAHDAATTNKDKIEAFINKHFPIPEPELVFNADGSPKLNEKGEQEKKAKQAAGRGPARKALALWIAENS